MDWDKSGKSSYKVSEKEQVMIKAGHRAMTVESKKETNLKEVQRD